MSFPRSAGSARSRSDHQRTTLGQGIWDHRPRPGPSVCHPVLHRHLWGPLMTMAPCLRKFVLTAHVTSSVGWLGAVTVFLALAVAGLTSQDAQTVRAAYLAM